MKKNKNKKSIISRLSDFSSNHWLLLSIIVAISASWSLILTYFGEWLGLISIEINNNTIVNKNLSPIAWIITIILIAGSAFSIITSRYKEVNDEDKINALTFKYWYLLLDKLVSSIDTVCRNKLNTQINNIISLKKTGNEPPIIYSEPCNQLKAITTEMKNCIAYLLSDKGRRFESNDIYISIAYNFPEEDKNNWQWAEQLADEKGLSIQELKAQGTTFSYVLDNVTEKSPYVFFNSKQEAYESGHYIPDNEDNYDLEHRLKGSIACFRVTVKKIDTEYIKAVISISSYKKQFVDLSAFSTEDEKKSEIENIAYNIYSVPVSEFSERIKIELCNYYIQLLRKNWIKNNSKKTP